MDGVLVDSVPMALEAGDSVLKSYGVIRTDKERRMAMGRKAIENYTYYVKSRGLKADPWEIIAKRDELYFKMIKGRLRALAGSAALIAELEKAGLKMAVASGSDARWVKANLEEVGLLAPFKTLVTADDIKNGKPDPEGFLLAAKRLGAKPEECVVFEDAENGVKAAKAAGMLCVGITNTPGQDLSRADIVVKSMEELSLSRLKSM